MLGLGVKRMRSVYVRWLRRVGVSGMRGIVGADRSSRKDEHKKSGNDKSLRDNHARSSKRLAVNLA